MISIQSIIRSILEGIIGLFVACCIVLYGIVIEYMFMPSEQEPPNHLYKAAFTNADTILVQTKDSIDQYCVNKKAVHKKEIGFFRIEHNYTTTSHTCYCVDYFNPLQQYILEAKIQITTEKLTYIHTEPIIYPDKGSFCFYIPASHGRKIKDMSFISFK